MIGKSGSWWRLATKWYRSSQAGQQEFEIPKTTSNHLHHIFLPSWSEMLPVSKADSVQIIFERKYFMLLPQLLAAMGCQCQRVEGRQTKCRESEFGHENIKGPLSLPVLTCRQPCKYEDLRALSSTPIWLCLRVPKHDLLLVFWDLNTTNITEIPSLMEQTWTQYIFTAHEGHSTIRIRHDLPSTPPYQLKNYESKLGLQDLVGDKNGNIKLVCKLCKLTEPAIIKCYN
jgi:hypothetical protein